MSYFNRTKGVSRFLGRDTPENGTAKELWSCSPSDGGFVEITITHPETVSWLKLNAEKQKRKLAEIFRYGIAAVPITYHVDSKCIFEFTGKGQIHLHGFLKISDTYKLFPIGCVSDIAKEILSHMPKKYSRFCTVHMYGEYCRYKSPPCLVQYRDIDDHARILTWMEYLDKLQI